MKTATILQNSMYSGALNRSAPKFFATEQGASGQARASKGEGARGVHPVLSATLLALCALSSAGLITLGYSFIHYLMR